MKLIKTEYQKGQKPKRTLDKEGEEDELFLYLKDYNSECCDSISWLNYVTLYLNEKKLMFSRGKGDKEILTIYTIED